MKIQSIETFKVAPRWVFLKMTTDDGLTGWGEPIVEGKADTVIACVDEMRDILIGQDASRIEWLWQAMYRANFYRGGPVLTSAMSGIEQALWDIRGKRFGVPVHELLGGAVRDKLQVYAWAGGEDAQGVVNSVRERVDQGYKTVKLCITDELGWVDNFKKLDRAAGKVGALRDAFGYDIDIAVDFHGRVHLPMARQLIGELEQYKLLYIEEPLQPEQVEGFRELRRHANVPIATGERMYTRWGFKELITACAVDILQPDLSHAGGIFECRKIAAMAESYDMAMAPHCPLGPIAFASCVQLDFCTPNAFIQEQSLEVHNPGGTGYQYLKKGSDFGFADGFIRRPEGPGLGIEVDEDKVRAAAEAGHSWHNPIWTLEDGSVAEW